VQVLYENAGVSSEKRRGRQVRVLPAVKQHSSQERKRAGERESEKYKAVAVSQKPRQEKRESRNPVQTQRPIEQDPMQAVASLQASIQQSLQRGLKRQTYRKDEQNEKEREKYSEERECRVQEW